MRIQSVPLAEINPNIKPVYWTKGKQAPATRQTYFETVGFHITGGKDCDLEKAINCYNAGREITMFIEKHLFTMNRNSATVTPQITRREIFTVDRKHHPLTQKQYDYLVMKLAIVPISDWQQQNIF